MTRNYEKFKVTFSHVCPYTWEFGLEKDMIVEVEGGEEAARRWVKGHYWKAWISTVTKMRKPRKKQQSS